MRSLLLACLACALALGTNADDATALLKAREVVGKRDSSELVCVIVRTYHGHGAHGNGSLERVLKSLQRQTHTRWEALLVVMDSTPFTDLRWSLDRLGDDRIWVYADWVGHQFSPKDKKGNWQPFYHNKLYELTDEAVRACPPDTEWVVITNGDNLYHEGALEYLSTAKGDVVAWDMYSRYQRPSGIPCERFQASEGAAPCKVNRLKWCHTDLGATAYRWPRFVREDRRFGGLDRTGVFTGQDGVMAGAVADAGWPVAHAAGRCLFDQGPSPQMCASNKGVWDERAAGTTSGFGGSCITREEAAVALAGGGVEALNVDLTHDGAFAGFGGGPDAVNFTIQCLRPREGHRHMLARAFPLPCAEEADAYLHAELDDMKTQR